MQGQEGVDFHYGSVDEIDPREWQVPQHCIPIHANVVTYNWRELYQYTQFDVIMMDPPWQLATANPTRGEQTLEHGAHTFEYGYWQDPMVWCSCTQ